MNYSLKHADKVIKGTVQLPASKSLSNRALMIQVLCQDAFTIYNISKAKDTQILQESLNSCSSEINVNDAGTCMRFLTAFLALKNEAVVLKGSKRMHQRPIAPLVKALNELGANISYLEKECYPPIKIEAGNLAGGKISVEGSISSQFISALLLIAPLLKGGLSIEICGLLVSKSYLEMTLNIMSFFGIEYSWEKQWIHIREQAYQAKDISIENDWSSAAFWFEIAALAQEAHIILEGMTQTSWQGDASLLKIFSTLGVTYDFQNDQLHISKTGFEKKPHYCYDLISTPDLAQPLCCTLAGLETSFVLKGLSTLNIKESQRIKALKNELLKLGFETTISEDSIESSSQAKITSSDIVHIKTYQDHRMAMSFAPLSLVCDEISISDIQHVEKSYPHFWEDLKKVGFTIKSLAHSNK